VSSPTETIQNKEPNQVPGKEQAAQSSIKENQFPTPDTGHPTVEDSGKTADKPIAPIAQTIIAEQQAPGKTDTVQTDLSQVAGKPTQPEATPQIEPVPVSDTIVKNVTVAPHPDRILQENKSASNAAPVKAEETNQGNIRQIDKDMAE